MFDNIKNKTMYNCTDIINADGTETRVYWSQGLAITYKPSKTKPKKEAEFIGWYKMFELDLELTVRLSYG